MNRKVGMKELQHHDISKQKITFLYHILYYIIVYHIIFIKYATYDFLLSRVQAMNREVKMKELQLLDTARQKFMTYTQNQKEAEIKRLDDEIKRKVHNRTSRLFSDMVMSNAFDITYLKEKR